MYCFLCCHTISGQYQVTHLEFKHHQMLFWVMLLFCMCDSPFPENTLQVLKSWVSLIQILGFQDPEPQHKIFNEFTCRIRNAAFEETPQVPVLCQAQFGLLVIHFNEFSKQPISAKQPFLINNGNTYSFVNHSSMSQRMAPFCLFALDSLKYQSNQHNRISYI